MKCLVTGGAGFIGSHLCERLLSEGHYVDCLDNLLTGREINIQHLKQNPKFRFLKQDVLSDLPSEIQAEYVFHFASPASPPKYQKYPVETLLVNTLGTYRLLEKSRSWNASFMFASTSEIYGDPLVHPQPESYWGNVNPVGERACYDESKRAGESFVSTYRRMFNLNSRIIRIFNTYGPRMDIDDGRVITNFIREYLHAEPYTIQGDGSQTRSFCYISDMIEGIMTIFNHPETNGEIFNIGSTEEINVINLLDIFQKITKYTGNVRYLPLPPDDPFRRRPDVSKMNQFGWRANVSIEDGLKKTLEYFRELENS